MITKIEFANFKIFKSKQSLELRPITILIGKNNSGKSAIAKLPTLLEESLKGTFSIPLKFKNNNISLGNSYADLVYNKYIAEGLRFNLTAGDETLNMLISSSFSSKEVPFFLEYIHNETKFDIEKTKFKGFVAEGVKFNQLSIHCDYIGAFRELPKPNYLSNSDEFNQIGINGENAYPLLIQWNNQKKPLFKEISKWYSENFEGWGLEVSSNGRNTPFYEISLANKGLLPVNITNVGQGIHQTLPLIVRSFMPTEEKTLIIMEEPETHLHPAAHANLATRFAESYIADNNKHYLIETHSQNFVLRLRLLVAQKKLKKEDLAIYYVDFDEQKNESILQQINVNDNGGVDYWPDGIFNETLIETRNIYNIQLNNSQNADKNK